MTFYRDRAVLVTGGLGFIGCNVTDRPMRSARG